MKPQDETPSRITHCKTQMTPLISVIIPVYNNPEALKQTLHSVINQTCSNIEIWVMNDGSETEIYPVIEELDDKRIRYDKLKHTNANVARNYGIRKSHGEYIAMLDSDDLWLSHHLESCLSLLLKEQADGLYGSILLRNAVTKHEQTIMARSLNKNETMIDYLLTMGCGAQTSTLFMTKESAKTILWDIHLNRHQDYDFVIRYSKQFKFVAKKESTVIYVTGNKQRHIDFESCIKVIKDNKEDIKPCIYYKYHLGKLKEALAQNALETVIAHYKREATFYKEYLSYSQFINIKYPKTRFENIKYKLEYLWHILKIRIEI
jgi:glycosyltransferase involved in cell wall biosynthesis